MFFPSQPLLGDLIHSLALTPSAGTPKLPTGQYIRIPQKPGLQPTLPWCQALPSFGSDAQAPCLSPPCFQSRCWTSTGPSTLPGGIQASLPSPCPLLTSSSATLSPFSHGQRSFSKAPSAAPPPWLPWALRTSSTPGVGLGGGLAFTPSPWAPTLLASCPACLEGSSPAFSAVTKSLFRSQGRHDCSSLPWSPGLTQSPVPPLTLRSS